MKHSLRELFDKIKDNYEYNEYNIYKVNDNINHLLHNNAFTTNEINKKILDNYHNTFYINAKSNKIYLVTDKKTINKKLANQLINRIISFKNYDGTPLQNKVFIWLVDDKKYLPSKKGQILGRENVNSASCQVYHPNEKINGDIYIWRKEEVSKLLLHELLHSLRYDYYSQDKELDNMVKKDFNVNGYINVNESYTEGVTVILNCIYCALENGKGYEYFIALLMNDINYSNIQVKKIMDHYGYHNINELYRKNSDKIFKQKTSVFSYYILKSILLNNVAEFSNFICKNNLKYPINNHQQYYKLFKNFGDNIVYNNLNNNVKRNDKSLRMTVTEL